MHATEVILIGLAIPPAIQAGCDIWSRWKKGTPLFGLRGLSVLFTVLLIGVLVYVMLTGGVNPKTFIAYYGDPGDLKVVGSKVDSPITLPNHIACPPRGDTNNSFINTALANICGSTAVPHVSSIGQSGGSGCGFNVLAGVCVKKRLPDLMWDYVNDLMKQ